MAHADVDDPIVAYMKVEGPELLHRFNTEFADAVLMVGRALGGHPDATVVEITAIDSIGIDALVTDPAGEHPARIEFATQLEAPEDMTMALIDLLGRAREVSGEEGQTKAEREADALSAIRTFVTEVVAVDEVHPHLRKVTFGGGDLTTFEPLGPDTFLYLLLPPPGRSELTIDQSFTWEAYARTPVEEQPVGAYYTLRHWRPEVAELDILMVLHGPEGDASDGHGEGGHASAWAERAKVGDPVALWGPRTAYEPPDDTDRLVLVADETALPAVAVILEQLPEGMPAHVVAEVANADEHHELPERDGVSVTWLHRDGAPAGRTSLLLDAVRSLAPFEGTPYVWGGGESRIMTGVRRHVRDERGLERDAVSLVAYWRHKKTLDAEVDA